MTRALIAVAALCIAPLAACTATSALQPPDQEPYVRGSIVSITHRATASTLRVEGGPGSREPCGIVATVDAETRYLTRTPAGTLGPGSLAALSEGDTVEVYVSGPVMESCPVQGRASSIVLIGRAGG